MTEKRWTPGPWAVGMRNGANANMVMARDGVDRRNGFDDSAITQVYGIAINRPLEDVKNDPGMPNAHLIAAAPDLYEAIKEGIDSLEFAVRELAAQASLPDGELELCEERLTEMRTALSKARGETDEPNR